LGAAVHDVAPAAEYVPSAQNTADVAPSAATNEPDGAGLHSAVPDSSVYDPAGHTIASVAPDTTPFTTDCFAAEPAGAGVHDDAPADEYDPLGHTVSLVAPAVAKKPARTDSHFN